MPMLISAIFSCRKPKLLVLKSPTRRLSKTAGELGDDCQNFPLAIGEALGEEGRRLFGSMGVDPAKATEAYVNLARDEGTIFYGATYVLFGRIERRVETVPDVTAAVWGRDRERWIGDNAHIFFADGRGSS